MEASVGSRGPTPMLEAGTWRCMACTKPSNNIQVLPCQHKFCASCLRLWAMIYIDMYNGKDDEFPCQVCWKRYAVPIQGLQAFEQDYQVKVLQDTMAQMSMGQGREPDRGQIGPFAYNPVIQSQMANSFNQDISNAPERIPEDMTNYMQQPYNVPDGAPRAVETAQSMQMDNNIPTPNHCNQSPGSVFPSMVTHMVPQPLTGSQEYPDVTHRVTPGPGYCMRSAHMYMHMV